MAIYTPLPLPAADRICRAHGLGGARAVEGVPAGSVNSNFLVDAEARRVFVRIYEEQGAEGVAYEWELLAHLASRGLPVPRRVAGPPPGQIQVANKPTAVFEIVGGDEVCQRMVDPARAATVGELLARAHLAGADFAHRRAGRFTRAHVRERLERAAGAGRPELAEAVGVLRRTLRELDEEVLPEVPSGVIHSDLFRDNVRFSGRRIEAVLDWESASDGRFVYDLAVTVLAWCYGEELRWDLASAMVAGYQAIRPLEPDERASARHALLTAAARFTTTRITDYHLREVAAPEPRRGSEGGSRVKGASQVKKDWRRFYARLQAVAALDADEIARRLEGG